MEDHRDQAPPGDLVVMEADARMLWEKLVDFKFDEEGATLTFAARLARENGWRLGFAQRVIEEYRRFLLLSMEAGHPVSPSEAVDQAWHLHLTYTRSYWTKLCGEILPRPLHHCPTLGGSEETEKFDSWYQKTLDSYEAFFDETPPQDIWAPAGQQMESVVDSRWVDTRQYFLIPRNPLKWLTFALLIMFPVLMFGGCAADAPLELAPLDYDGPTFLKFIGVVGGLSVVMALAIRFLYPIHDPPIPIDVDTPGKKAYLAQGPKGLVLAAIAKMIEDGTLKMEEASSGWIRGKSYHLSIGNPLPADASEIERQIYLEAHNCKPGEIGKLVVRTIPLAREEGAMLQEMGLVEPNPCEPFFRRWVPSLLMLGIAGLCGLKLVIGLSRGKPILFLVLIIIASLIAAYFLFRRGFRTDKGEEVLDEIKRDHSHLKTQRNENTDADYSPSDVFLAAGIFGLGAFAVGDISHLHQEAERSRFLNGGYGNGAGCTGGWPGTGCSSCGSGCGSSCGGGGCGGGGCGGCGS